jgi:hypothetical protein
MPGREFMYVRPGPARRLSEVVPCREAPQAPSGLTLSPPFSGFVSKSLVS